MVSQVNDSDILKCKIEFDDDVVKWLVSRIDSKATGARSVQRLVEGSMSRLIGDSFVNGTLAEGKIYRLRIDKQDRLEIAEAEQDRR